MTTILSVAGKRTLGLWLAAQLRHLKNLVVVVSLLVVHEVMRKAGAGEIGTVCSNISGVGIQIRISMLWDGNSSTENHIVMGGLGTRFRIVLGYKGNQTLLFNDKVSLAKEINNVV